MKVYLSILVVVFCFLIGGQAGGFSQDTDIRGERIVIIAGTARSGDSIGFEHDFGVAYRADDALLFCSSDHVVLYRVYEETGRFIADRLKVSLRKGFDQFGIWVKRVRVYEKFEDGEHTSCELEDTE